MSLDPKALANGLAEVYRIEALERIEAARRDLQVGNAQGAYCAYCTGVGWWGFV